MKVILYMTITPNGLIAKEKDNTSYLSKAVFVRYDKLCKKIGNLIIGRRTYDVSVAENAFPYPGLNVVLTNKHIKNKWGSQVIFTNRSPKEVLKLLKERGFKTALVGGGGKLNSSFMKERLVDEIYLEVTPMIFGKGIKVFEDSNFEAKLELLGVKKLSSNEIQLHYKILK